ncbi:MAG TPA: DUF4013 domain-containing protein [Candidatus Dormibacteraeota bacterium]
MDRIGEAFVWPFRDPEWVNKIVIMGLILLIPIVGAIDGLGWMLAALHRLRAGEERLPPANFDHLGRGFRLFLVFLVYYLVLTAVAALIYVPAVLLFAEQGRQESSNPVLVSIGLGLSLLAFSFVTLSSLVMTFLTPAIILAADRGGIAAGLRVTEVVRRARISLTNTLVAGLMLIAASLVAQLGSVACIVGVVFTAAYAFAMQAWIVRSYELGTT